jgi:putative ABC transport system permease protein
MANLRNEALEIARRLARTPSLALPLILATALGVGVSTAAWTAVDAVLLRPLPYPAPERLVMLWQRALAGGDDRIVVSLPDFADWRERSRSFERLAAWNVWFPSLTGTDRPEKLLGAMVSADFFPALGAKPLRGRLFFPREEGPGHDVVVLSAELWRRRFAADPHLVGKTVELDGVPYTVVGILEPGFAHPEPLYLDEATQLWKPLGLDPAAAPRGLRFLRVLGRLRPRVSRARAQAEMEAVAARLAGEHPDEDGGLSVALVPLRDQLAGAAARGLALLLGAAGLVLLVACADAAGLLLVGAARQAHDTALRSALGAPRSRLVLRALLESLLPTLAGGGLGLLFGVGGARALLAAGPRLPRAVAVGLDPRALAFALAACLATALLAGLAPALATARADPAALLADPGSRAAIRSRDSGRSARLLAFVVAAEAALCLPLLTGTGLLARSLAQLSRVPLGFTAEGALTFRLELPARRYAHPADLRSAHERLLQRLSALPGVRAAGATSSLPLSGLFDLTRDVGLEPGRNLAAGFRAASPGYFPALGIPLRAGRLFDERDRDGAPAVALVNESFTRAAWPGLPPLPHRVTLQTAAGGTVAREVVGVLGDIRHEGPAIEPRPELFVPLAQAPTRFATYVLRTAGSEADPAALAPPLRAALRSIDPDLAPGALRPLVDLVQAALAPHRFHRLLALVLSAIALLLAVLGLYGTAAFSAHQRARELGIRMALGANRRRVVIHSLRQALAPALAGAVAGLLASLFLGRILGALLFGVSPRDPLALVGAPILLLLAAFLAGLLPAHRAARTDPAVTLREP